MNLLSFTVSGAILPLLLNTIYHELTACDNTSYQHVSPSMFGYYCYTIYQYRILIIRKMKETLDMEDMKTLDVLENLQLWIPTPLAIWLSGIGDVQSTDQGNVDIILPEALNEHGHYGRVNARTHSLYENWPAPLVYTRRIVEDIRYSLHLTDDERWDLPDAVRAMDQGCGYPTANLLGYTQAQDLLLSQIQLLGTFGINERTFTTDNALNRYQINLGLLQYVSGWLDKIKTNYKMHENLPKDKIGSEGQLFLTTSALDTYAAVDGFSADSTYVEMPLKLSSCYNGDLRIAANVAILPYQVARDAVCDSQRVTRSWCAYDFDQYMNVPDAWNATRNACFHRGTYDIWSVIILENNFVEVRTTLQMYIRRFTIDKSNSLKLS